MYSVISVKLDSLPGIHSLKLAPNYIKRFGERLDFSPELVLFRLHVKPRIQSEDKMDASGPADDGQQVQVRAY